MTDSDTTDEKTGDARMSDSPPAGNAPTSMPSLSPEGSLSRYLQEIRKFPILEHEHEYMPTGIPPTSW